MKAKRGYREQKWRSPYIGRWLHYYFEKRTSRRWNWRCLDRLGELRRG